MKTHLERHIEAKRLAVQYQPMLRDESELNGYAEEYPIRVVFFITRGKIDGQPQGKAAGYITASALEEYGLNVTSKLILDKLISLDQSDQLIETPESSPAPFICKYNESFEVLGR